MKANVEPRLQESKAIQRMFAEIAHRYDFLNHFLSLSIDRRWRRLAVAKVGEHLHGRGAICLDLCSGTGDLAIELQRRLGIDVVAADFCHPMLVRCADKVRASHVQQSIRPIEADSLGLPFSDNSFDALTIGFGLRNLEDWSAGLREMHRVLKPGGVATVLEFSRPVNPLFRRAFELYLHHVLPRLGAVISGNAAAYRYLPESMRRFPPQPELAEMMRAAGFVNVAWRNFFGGVAALHWGISSKTNISDHGAHR